MAQVQKGVPNNGAVQQRGGNGDQRASPAERLMPQRLLDGLQTVSQRASPAHATSHSRAFLCVALTREEARSFVPPRLSFGMRALNFLFVPLFKQWVAGPKLEDALREVAKVNARFENAVAIINFLGEHYKATVQVRRAMFEYYNAIDYIAERGLRSSVSIKPSKFGFDVQDFQGTPEEQREWCFANMRAIVEYAAKKGVFVWLDMEGSNYTQFTTYSYTRLLCEFDNVGIVLQANMRRTMRDLKELLGLDRDTFFAPKIRLCKGIYNEPPEIAFQTRAEVNDNMYALQSQLYITAPADVWRVTASHDDTFLDNAARLAQNCSGSVCRSQMLRGVRTKLFEEIAASGGWIEVYTPYGEDMIPYSVRRARESPQLRGLLVRGALNWFYDKFYPH